MPLGRVAYKICLMTLGREACVLASSLSRGPYKNCLMPLDWEASKICLMPLSREACEVGRLPLQLVGRDYDACIMALGQEAYEICLPLLWARRLIRFVCLTSPLVGRLMRFGSCL